MFLLFFVFVVVGGRCANSILHIAETTIYMLFPLGKSSMSFRSKIGLLFYSKRLHLILCVCVCACVCVCFGVVLNVWVVLVDRFNSKQCYTHVQC